MLLIIKGSANSCKTLEQATTFTAVAKESSHCSRSVAKAPTANCASSA